MKALRRGSFSALVAGPTCLWRGVRVDGDDDVAVKNSNGEGTARDARLVGPSRYSRGTRQLQGSVERRLPPSPRQLHHYVGTLR